MNEIHKRVDPYVKMRMPILWDLIIPLNTRGICVDRSRRDALRAEREDRLKSWRSRAARHFKKLGMDLPLGPKGAPSSPKVQAILYDALGLPVQFDLKDQTKRTAGKKALKRILSHDDSGTVKLLLEYSELRDAFVPLMSRESPDGRMRTRFIFGGDEKSAGNELGRGSPASGRLSSRQVNQHPPLGTNLQNWKEWVRCVLVARAGWKLVKADYSQIELRLTAHFSGDRNLKAAFDAGDAYTYIMFLLDRETDCYGLGKWSLKDLLAMYEDRDERITLYRDETKRIALGWTYRMGAKKMENVHGIPFQRGKRALAGLERAFPQIVTWWRELEMEVIEKSTGSGWGWIENAWGRRRYFFTEDVPAICNFLPQSSAADILFDAMLAIEYRYKRLIDGPKLLLTIHDEVVLESDDPIRTAEDVRTLMELPIDALDGLRIPAEVYVGRNWAKHSATNPQGVKRVA